MIKENKPFLKRYQLILLIFLGLVIVLWVIGRATGALQFYNMPTGSMEPSLAVGQKYFTTNLKKPKRNDIIVFNRRVNKNFENDINGKLMQFTSRLIALENDTLQVINGYAYVNGKSVDDSNSLKFIYHLPRKDLNNLLTALDIDPEDKDYNINFYQGLDTSFATLSGKQYTQVRNVIPLRRYIINNQSPVPGIYPSKDWTLDNFGPYKIPSGFCFVMGDNRHNAQDSRYIGPIYLKDATGVLLWKL